MHGREPTPAVRVGAAADGTLTYLVDATPESLPPVRGRDLLAAWDAARDAAGVTAWGVSRLFRFRRGDGGFTDLVLADRDACCWAGAVDRTVGIGSSYGLSLCLRLLALVELMARARWTTGLFTIEAGGAELHPALLRAAAAEPLDPDARFNEARLRACLARLPSPEPGVPA